MSDSSFEAFWDVITRLGEAQILLPAALLLAAWFAWRGHSWRLAATWLAGITAATLVTTASKVAFIGYGVGWPALNFTGVSGHSMFAAAIYPLAGIAVCSAVAGPRSISWQRIGLAIGVVVAIVVGVSRVAISAHSWSEVLIGLAVGGAASAMALWAERLPPARPPLWLPLVVCLWLTLTPAHAPASNTHGLVTSLSLSLSGRSEPYSREDMLATWNSQRAMR